jgi:hypothetical protein
MERDTQAQEPETTAAEPPQMAEELSDEQLDQFAGGIIGTELDSGFQAEDGARTRHTGGANF